MSLREEQEERGRSEVTLRTFTGRPWGEVRWLQHLLRRYWMGNHLDEAGDFRTLAIADGTPSYPGKGLGQRLMFEAPEMPAMSWDITETDLSDALDRMGYLYAAIGALSVWQEENFPP